MDVLSIKPRTIDVALKHPSDGSPLGVTIKCASAFSDEVMAAMFRVRDDALKANFFEMTSAEKDHQGAKMLAAQIVGWTWSGGASLGTDKAPTPTEENKLKLLANRLMRMQIESAIANDAAFFDGPGGL